MFFVDENEEENESSIDTDLDDQEENEDELNKDLEDGVLSIV